MPYFLDGDNLVGRALGRPGSTDERHALVREVSDRLRRTRASAVLFFDGAGSPVSLGGLSVRFAAPGSADDAIVREVGRLSSAREAIVVTADRSLAARARDAGARAMSPEEFWSSFGKGSRPGSAGGARGDEPRVDVDDWARWFADDKNRKGG